MAGASLLLAAFACVQSDGSPIPWPPNVSTSPELCDAGAASPSAPTDLVQALEPCCDGQGRWVPPLILPPREDTSRLQLDPSTGRVCVPEDILRDPGGTPDSCTSVFGLPGACLADCVPELRGTSPQDSCAKGQLCAPCTDPRTHLATGACTRGAMACEPPVEIQECDIFEPSPHLLDAYPACLDGAGRCVPRDEVPAAHRDRLQRCGGEDSTALCAPNQMVLTGGRGRLQRCRAIGGREGRCLSRHLDDVAARAEQLEQASCPDGELCSLCYDPITHADTGACSAEPCDRPVEPRRPFEPCGRLGPDALCVPEAQVPDQYRTRFDGIGCGIGCAEPNTLCVPRDIIEAGPSYRPTPCDAGNNGPGVCLSECIPEVPSIFSQGSCAVAQLCVPCSINLVFFDVPTGACDF